MTPWALLAILNGFVRSLRTLEVCLRNTIQCKTYKKTDKIKIRWSLSAHRRFMAWMDWRWEEALWNWGRSWKIGRIIRKRSKRLSCSKIMAWIYSICNQMAWIWRRNQTVSKSLRTSHSKSRFRSGKWRCHLGSLSRDWTNDRIWRKKWKSFKLIQKTMFPSHLSTRRDIQGIQKVQPGKFCSVNVFPIPFLYKV